MKKIYMAMTVLAAAALTSCVNEKSFENGTPIGKNAIAFSVQGGATRASESAVTVRQGAKIPFVREETTSFYLEETVTNLDLMEPATKGTPAYTENVGVLYADQLAVHAVGLANGAASDAVFTNLGQEMVGNGWRYNHDYGKNPWPEEGAVDFYLSMPADMTGATITGYENGSITFTYQSPANASAQQDILFAYTSLTEAQHKTFLPDGAPVLFRHALTGVKFAIENFSSPDEENISIKEVIFSGLKDSGTCTITPAKNDAQDFSQYKDVIDYYSSAAAVNWGTPQRASTTKEVEVEGEDGEITTETVTEFYSYPSGTYTDTVYFAPGGSFADKGAYPESYSAAGHKHNLNDANAMQTFWFIPQAMTNDVTLTIKYTYGSDEVKEGVIEFGKALAGVTWNAGELRTYTIRVDDVNVKIEDTVTIDGSVDDGYVGSVKENVTITNTGNTKAFIRAAIVGQWLDSEGNPVFGFSDKINQLFIVESWYEDQFGENANHNHGEFVGLAGYDQPNRYNGWTLCTDGYYYYMTAIDPTAQTATLFDTYTVKQRPLAEMSGNQQVRKDMYFTLEIATQAISAMKLDGTEYTWEQAWENASGVKPEEKN